MVKKTEKCIETKSGDYFLQLAKARKTTYEFSDKQVEETDVLKILEAGRWAPSCTNIQPWQFVVIKDKERISEIMKTTFYGGFHTDPPLIIALILINECLQEDREHKCAHHFKSGICEAFTCLGMAALNMAFEAQELGIASAFLSPHEKAAKIVECNKDGTVPLMIAFGYEKSGAFQKKRERKELKDIVSYECYREAHP